MKEKLQHYSSGPAHAEKSSTALEDGGVTGRKLQKYIPLSAPGPSYGGTCSLVGGVVLISNPQFLRDLSGCCFLVWALKISNVRQRFALGLALGEGGCSKTLEQHGPAVEHNARACSPVPFGVAPNIEVV